MRLWEEEDKIAIDINISCVMYTDIPRKMLTKKNDDASEAEVASKPASEFSSDERGDAEVI